MLEDIVERRMMDPEYEISIDVNNQKEFLTKYYSMVREKAIQENWKVLPKGPLSPKKVVEEKIQPLPQVPAKAMKQWGGSQELFSKKNQLQAQPQPQPVVENNPQPKVKVKGKWFQ